MGNKKGPALYELITNQSKTAQPTQKIRQHHEFHDQDEDLAHNVLTPGRSVRMSIGTAGICVAVCIALIVISYTMGFRRGHAIAREDYGNRLFEEIQTNSSEVTPTTVALGSPQSALESSKSNPWGLLTSDPRITGQHYYVLMHTTRDGAIQLGEFCRNRGLETYVVSGHNTQSYQVIALPGFKERRSSGAEELRTQIAAIGKQWAKTRASAGSNLQDAYPTLYN